LTFPRNLRRHFVIQYAEYIMSDPSMWRIAIQYLGHCGPPGTGTANQILIHLPFTIPGIKLTDEAHSQALVMFTGAGKKAAPMADLTEILDVCNRFSLYEAKSAICRVGIWLSSYISSTSADV
jgi:nuclear pore complex protein Nup85